MLALLNDQPILVLMATVALGAAVGTIPLGKIRLGASGALFVGLLVGAVLPDVGDRLALFQSFGLALFAYLIGLGAGKVFFRDLRRNLPLMLAAVVVVILTAFTVHPLAALLNLDLPTAIGVWTGSLTATPAMALANQLTGPDATGHRPVVALVQRTPAHDGVDLDQALILLNRLGLPALALPYDRHLAAGGPIQPDLIAEATVAAATALAARVLAVARVELTQELGRAPTVGELAHRAGIDDFGSSQSEDITPWRR